MQKIDLKGFYGQLLWILPESLSNKAEVARIERIVENFALALLKSSGNQHQLEDFEEVVNQLLIDPKGTGGRKSDYRISINHDSKEASVGKNTVDLRAGEYSILEAIFHHGSTATLEQIVRHVYGEGSDIAQKTDTVHQQLRTLRAKLRQCHSFEYIKFRKDVGYTICQPEN